LRINTSATSAVFKTLKHLNCYPADTLAVIPNPATTTPAVANVVEPVVEQPVVFRTVKAKTTAKTDKGVEE
jgi:hypothetical protein